MGSRMCRDEQARRDESLATERHDGQGGNDATSGAASTDNDTTSDEARTYTAEELETARHKLKAATAWRARNPRAYATIERLALEEAARGHAYGGKYLAELTRQRNVIEDKGGDYYTLSNNYTAVFARWLSAEHPEIAHLIRMRPCALDVAMQEARHE